MSLFGNEKDEKSTDYAVLDPDLGMIERVVNFL